MTEDEQLALALQMSLEGSEKDTPLTTAHQDTKTRKDFSIAKEDIQNMAVKILKNVALAGDL